MHHTVAISDIHLCELEPTAGLWMRYRQAPYSPDRELAAMLDALRGDVRRGAGGAGRDELTLVLNGDIFDLDAPRVINNESVVHDLPRTAEHAVPAIEAILSDHPVFVEALGRVVADGHTVVFVAGNHDIQLTLPEVRAAVQRRVVDAAAREVAARDGAPPAAGAAELRRALAARVVFRAWFHRTRDGVILEHGNQYDSYCSYRYPMAPFGRNPGEIQPTMGSLVSRLLVSRMGYFNPHVDSSFMLSGLGYLAHWARYYLFSGRSLVLAFAVGAARTMIELVRRREPGRRARRRAGLVAAARETGAPLAAVAKHARLFARPAEDCLGRVARELWLDRCGLALVGLLAALACLCWVPEGLAPAALLAPTLLIAYECAVPKPTLDAVWQGVNRAARLVARAHGAKAVIFGHTHNPEGSWEGGVFFGNTGSWSAAFEDIACTRPVFEARPLVWLRSEDGAGPEAPLSGGLVMWKDQRFLPWKADEAPRVSRKAVAARRPRPALRPQATAALRG
ncbi:hypothetical protein SOCEGT47_007750 [Sorangium cellulosum]|uniref:Calcineurin-like phosphoesterase domain-containing protein n=2 Tax=Sorangium cellulosum TaxID=56 RepID=A0A4P2PUF2_SORCE|nr:hypothetical protein SOCEGT47_007750 [Sorangium cellulosum]